MPNTHKRRTQLDHTKTIKPLVRDPFFYITVLGIVISLIPSCIYIGVLLLIGSYIWSPPTSKSRVIAKYALIVVSIVAVIGLAYVTIGAYDTLQRGDSF